MIPTWTTTMFARRSFRSPLPRDRCVSRWWMLNFSRGIFSLLQHGKAGIWMLICCGVYVYHIYTYTYIYIIHTYTYRYVHYLPILLGGLNRKFPLCLFSFPWIGVPVAVGGGNPAITSWYGRFSHYLQGFRPRWLALGFLKHQHQQYVFRDNNWSSNFLDPASQLVGPNKPSWNGSYYVRSVMDSPNHGMFFQGFLSRIFLCWSDPDLHVNDENTFRWRVSKFPFPTWEF